MKAAELQNKITWEDPFRAAPVLCGRMFVIAANYYFVQGTCPIAFVCVWIICRAWDSIPEVKLAPVAETLSLCQWVSCLGCVEWKEILGFLSPAVLEYKGKYVCIVKKSPIAISFQQPANS